MGLISLRLSWHIKMILWIAVFSSPSYAILCKNFFNPQSTQLKYVYTLSANPSEGIFYLDLSKKIEALLLKILPKNQDFQSDEPLNIILEHVLHNTLQHGLNQHVIWKDRRLNVAVKIWTAGEFTFTEVTSPKIKSFPKSLEGEFSYMNRVMVKELERVGFKGDGIATGDIFDALEFLPLGSTVKWSSSNETVTFRLKVSHKDQE